MLFRDFYTIEHTNFNDSGGEFRIALNPNHVIFSGHFPGQPVLPGVCTMQIMKECTQQIVDTKLQYANISQCKFLRYVDPVQCNEITLNISIVEKEEGAFQLIANGTNGDSPFIKMKAVVKKTQD
jgi:3-hydroxyacyl-[acyl-carrier-protein] dehydratase